MPRKPKHHDAPPVVPPAVEQRAPDQDGAVEVAFVEGTLPEEDRRQPLPEAVVVDGAVVEAAPVAAPVEVAPVVEVRNDELHIIRKRADGLEVNGAGCILDRDPPRKVAPPSGKGFE